MPASSYRKYKRGFLVEHGKYFLKLLMACFGVMIFKQLYHIFVTEFIRTCRSKQEFVVTLRSK